MGLFQWIKSVFEPPKTAPTGEPTTTVSDSPSSPIPEVSSPSVPLDFHTSNPHQVLEDTEPQKLIAEPNDQQRFDLDLAASIDTQEPLKRNHRRKAVRDIRFQTKPREKLEIGLWRRRKKVRVFQSTDARRFFSDSLRTQNKNLRDLATDETQLERHRLPIWRNEADIAAALGVSVTLLRHYSIHRSRERTSHYITFSIPKRSGGERIIHAPKRRLKALQRSLQELMVSKLPVSNVAHGFLKARSVATNAAPHVGKAFVVKLDLANCFPSIEFPRVRGLLLSVGYSFPVATVLALIMTEPLRQPVESEGNIHHVPIGPRFCVQGAPTSPGICNAILLRLDRRLAGLAKTLGFSFTRYADDLTFSGDDQTQLKKLISLAARIVREEGFRIRYEKTKVQRKSKRQRVTGVIVNQTAGLSRKERRRLRAEIHQLHRSGVANKAKILKLAGKLAYLHMLNPAQAAPLRRALTLAVSSESQMK